MSSVCHYNDERVININAHEEVYQWEVTEAVHTLKRCGIQSSMSVMDLGCGHGHYTIPAALAVGHEGRVIAVDHDKKVLRNTSQRFFEVGLSNIEILNANHLNMEIPDGSIDFLMIYDMIHMNSREEIYQLAKRVLKKEGILSLLAFGEIRIRKNIKGQIIKSDNNKNTVDSFTVALKILLGEIESFGFIPSSVIENEGVHFDHFHSPYHWKKHGQVRLDSLERGNIINFIKG